MLQENFESERFLPIFAFWTKNKTQKN